MSIAPSAGPSRTPGLTAKEEVLARIRAALSAPGQSPAETADVPRRYQRADDKQETSTDPTKIRDVLARRLEEYRAHVVRTTPAALAQAIADALTGAGSLVVPSGVPEEWLGELDDATAVTVDDGSAGTRDLDRIGAVLTGCHTAIAMTATVILRSDEVCGRRAITLLPDHHVVVVDASQVVLGVPLAIERMNEDPTAAWTMISGPSATSDIELERVEGVHGPRRLDVILVEPEPEDEAEPEAAPDPEGEPVTDPGAAAGSAATATRKADQK